MKINNLEKTLSSIEKENQERIEESKKALLNEENHGICADEVLTFVNTSFHFPHQRIEYIKYIKNLLDVYKLNDENVEGDIFPNFLHASSCESQCIMLLEYLREYEKKEISMTYEGFLDLVKKAIGAERLNSNWRSNHRIALTAIYSVFGASVSKTVWKLYVKIEHDSIIKISMFRKSFNNLDNWMKTIYDKAEKARLEKKTALLAETKSAREKAERIEK
jgi:hypothetical protein